MLAERRGLFIGAGLAYTPAMGMDANKSAVLVVAVALAACGGARAKDAPTPSPTSGEEGPVTWDPSWDHDEKADFMKAHVLPEMKPAFQAFSAERWDGFNCKTCHGDPWQDHPRDAIPRLTLKGGEFEVPEDEKPLVEFMKTEVVPKMAALFGQKPYDPATGEGFGCGGCHTVDVVE